MTSIEPALRLLQAIHNLQSHSYQSDLAYAAMINHVTRVIGELTPHNHDLNALGLSLLRLAATRKE